MDRRRSRGAAAGERQDRHVLVQQRRRDAAGGRVRLVHARGAGTRRAARASTTSSTARASTRTAGTRSSATPRPSTRCPAGQLTITTSPGDIYTGDTNPPPNNFILQDAAHAGVGLDDRDEDLGGHDQQRLRPGRPDRLRRRRQLRQVRRDLRARARRGSTGSSCARRSAARSRTRRRTSTVPAGNAGGPFYLRLTKTGTNYAGEYSYDGATWTAFPGGTVPNPMQAPDFGLFAFGPQATAVGETVSFDYFWLDGQDPPDECTCEAGAGDEFDGASLDTTKFNAIVRDDPTRYTVQGGQLEATTINGDIYQTPNGATCGAVLPADGGPRRRRLGDRDEGRRDRAQRRIRAGRPAGPRRRRQLHQVRHPVRRRADGPQPDRAAQRGRRGDPEPAAAALAAPGQQRDGVAAPDQDRVRTTRASTRSTARRSRRSRQRCRTRWPSRRSACSRSASTAVAAPRTSTTSRSTATAASARSRRRRTRTRRSRRRRPSPTIGFAPLPVQFTAAATDPDAGDTVSYSWDFGDGSPASTQQNPTHTYTTPGDTPPSSRCPTARAGPPRAT